MSKITPRLWYDGTAEEAANFYVTLLPDSRIEVVNRSPIDTEEAANSIAVLGANGPHRNRCALPGFPLHGRPGRATKCRDHGEPGAVPTRWPQSQLTAGPAYFDDFVLDVVVIPAQKTRDLLDREAAHEHVAQLVQLRIRPFPLYGRRFGVRAGRLWIEDRGADQAQQRFVLGISWPAEECTDFYIGHLTA